MRLTRPILALLRQAPGLSDREISRRLFGDEDHRHQVQTACCHLELRGFIERDRNRTPSRNFVQQIRPLVLVAPLWEGQRPPA